MQVSRNRDGQNGKIDRDVTINGTVSFVEIVLFKDTMWSLEFSQENDNLQHSFKAAVPEVVTL